MLPSQLPLQTGNVSKTCLKIDEKIKIIYSIKKLRNQVYKTV